MAKMKQQRSKTTRPVSPAVVWLSAIAATVIAIIIYGGLFWLNNQSPNTVSGTPVAQTELNANEILIIGLVMCVAVFGPGILVALIVLPIMRKNKKK